MVSSKDIKLQDGRIIDHFILIGESIDLCEGISEPVKLAENTFLKRASDQYIAIIKKHMHPFFFLNPLGMIIHETKAIPNSDGNGTSIEERSRKDWQYWIITHTNFYTEENLERSIELSELNLTPVLNVFGEKGLSHTLNPQIASSYYQDKLYCEVRVLKKKKLEDINDVRNLLDDFSKYEDQFPIIKKAIKDFVELKALPPKSPFIIIGVFSIIELLLTSNNKSSPTISHQLRTKIPLLNRRFEIPLVFSKFFKGPDNLTEEKIIDKLYNYRSDIAHGNLTDFESELQILHSDKNTIIFLKLFLRRLIRHCLTEPELIEDLKKC